MPNINQQKELTNLVTASRLLENTEELPDNDMKNEVYLRLDSGFIVSKNTLEETTMNLFQANKKFEQTLSKKEFQEVLKGIVLDCLTHKINPVTSALSNLLKKIEIESPLQTWEVFRPLYGAKFSSSETLELGCYKVYSISKYQEVVKMTPRPDFLTVSSPIAPQHHLIISVKVDARDKDKANELSCTKFQQFDNIISYMLGSSNNSLDVGVFEYVGGSIEKIFLLSSTGWHSSSSFNGVLQPVELDGKFPVTFEGMDQERFSSMTEHYFKNPQIGHEWIWEVASMSNPTKLQSKLITAIEWVGKAIRDNDNARAFVQVVFAFESIFTFQEKNVLVSPGIANQISESVAFILGTNLEERIVYEKQAKTIYGNRSAIAHGGSSSISDIELDEAINLIKRVILKMTTETKFKSMNSIEEFYKWMQQQKYSCGEATQTNLRAD
jgi:hypothetical protein